MTYENHGYSDRKSLMKNSTDSGRGESKKREKKPSSSEFSNGVGTEKVGRSSDSEVKTVKVSNLSLKASERDLREFFSLSGNIMHVETQRHSKRRQKAFVTFTDCQEAEAAALLSGTTIVDAAVNVTLDPEYELPPGVSRAFVRNADSVKAAIESVHVSPTTIPCSKKAFGKAVDKGPRRRKATCGDKFAMSVLVGTCVLILLLGFYRQLYPPDPYSLELRPGYQRSMLTDKYGIEFYVRSPSAFDEEYASGTLARSDIEDRIITSYKNKYCQDEQKGYSRRRGLPTPHCDMFQEL